MLPVKVIALSGSIRAGSSNRALLLASARLAPARLTIELFDGIGTLPHFDPDLDREGIEVPPPVREFRALLIGSDGVLISSPEYAHGVPGSFKNALDWLVSVGELVDIPVMLMNAAPVGCEFAQAAILETLRTMNWRVLAEHSLAAPFLRRKLAAGVELDDTAAAAIRESLEVLAEAATARRAERRSTQPA
jgi:NAD(P)H-dependent FMN reductase